MTTSVQTAQDATAGTGPGTGLDAERSPERLIGLFAEESRVRAFAAVALGAASPAEVAELAGLTAKGAATALLRLREHGVVTSGADGEPTVAYDLFRELARTARPRPAADDPGTGDERTDMVLRTFVREGRLVRLPARWNRRELVLRHIAEQTFVPGIAYPERVVDEKLGAWCEDGEVDHVSLRRYLVDLRQLSRSEGVYRRLA
ncbi:DUF2087 domain-containing protein [Streptomyces sp. NPDC006458]|uniref:DUF2087 domain-containing protein n=1 Tax=Streptomyces sp. NPDC006458 TaxID=3154302 RepID=UPI0033A97DA7